MDSAATFTACPGGSITGTTLAAIVLTLLPEMLRPVKDLRPVIYAVLLIVMMLTRPQGIFGAREISLARLFPRRRKSEGTTTV